MKELFVRILRRMHLFRGFNFVFTLSVCGRRVRVPFIHGVALSGIEEPWMYGLLKHFLGRTTGAVIDVGVNVGQTLILVKCVDPSRDYIGFEPNPTCVSYVNDLIRRNRFENCTVVPAALHREDALLSLELYHNYAADGTASVIEGFRVERPVISRLCVAALRYATAAAGLPPVRIGLVKIDVEGAEHEVLLSLRDVVSRDRPVVLMEILPIYSLTNTGRLERQKKVESLLREWGYVLLRVRKEGARFAGFDDVLSIGIHGDLSQCDYVAVPNESRVDL